MSEAAVRLVGLRKVFGHGQDEVVAVDSVDLDVRDGEFFAMLGPSGSGKTTVLRMIAGFESPTAGQVQLAGRDVTGEPPFDRDVNTVFQDYALFPHMNVIENVSYGLMVKGVGKAERRSRARDALATMRLEGMDQHAAAGRLLEAGDQAQTGGLAGAGRAQHGEELAVQDVEADLVHGLDRTVMARHGAERDRDGFLRRNRLLGIRHGRNRRKEQERETKPGRIVADPPRLTQQKKPYWPLWTA